jgi:hypothetical protein
MSRRSHCAVATANKRRHHERQADQFHAFPQGL